MFRGFLIALSGLVLVPVSPPALAAQGSGWRPPTREMPAMPRTAELAGDWLAPRAGWFQGVEGVAGVSRAQLRAVGDPLPGTAYVQVARFTSGPLPVVVWSDRNGDHRADLIEFFRTGALVLQLIDADYDGNANVLRAYDARGTLLHEERM